MASDEQITQQRTIYVRLDTKLLALESTPDIISTLEQFWQGFITPAPLDKTPRLTIIKDADIEPEQKQNSTLGQEEVVLRANKLFFTTTHSTGEFNLLTQTGSIHITALDNKNMYPLKTVIVAIFGWFFLQEGTLLLHACGIEKNNKGYLFLGEPGSGKSTLAKKNEQTSILGDECIGLKKEEGQSILFATPIPGEMSPLQQKTVPLEQTYILKKNKQLQCKTLTKKEVFYNLLEHNLLFMMFDKQSPKLFKQLITVTATYSQTIQGSVLSSRKEDDIWQVIP
jgi:hypothetical protein